MDRSNNNCTDSAEPTMDRLLRSFTLISASRTCGRWLEDSEDKNDVEPENSHVETAVQLCASVTQQMRPFQSTSIVQFRVCSLVTSYLQDYVIITRDRSL